MSWINRENKSRRGDEEKKYPFAKWMSWLFLAVSMLLLIYTYYRAEITYQGANHVKYFKYYLISLAGILFWGVVLRLREGIRANIVTIIIALIIGLYMIEGGLTLLGLGQPQNNRAAAVAAAELGVEYDERSKLQVIDGLIEKGVDAVPAVRPADVLTMDEELLPLGGVSNKTTVATNENGYYMVYTSDRYGFNNPDSEWDAEQVEWLLTGDSFTEGEAVNPGEDVAGQIRLITKQPTINVGRGGNGPLIELAELREYAELVKPKKVLWLYFEGNDLKGDLQGEKLNPILMQYMEDGFSQNLINRQKEVDSRLREYVDSRLREYLVSEQAQGQTETQLYRTRWIRLYAIRSMISFDDDVDFDVNVDDPLFAKILTKAKAHVEGWGGELYFIYLPEYSRYKKVEVSHNDFGKKSEVIDLVKRLNIPVIDIHQETFADHPDPLSLFPFRLSGHYNADGYAEVAKAIVDSVKEHEEQNNK